MPASTSSSALRGGSCPQDVAPPVTASTDASDARAEPPWAPDHPWLQRYPGNLLDSAAPSETEPDAIVASRETIELAYLAALQHLPPRQRAILIPRDALGWSRRRLATRRAEWVTRERVRASAPIARTLPRSLRGRRT
jgi:RNA polymerase sigma-70 factor (ECF subfamily)